MKKHIKVIQSRLYRKGLKVSQPEIKEVYQQMVNDTENPTEQELESMVNYFQSNDSKNELVPQNKLDEQNMDNIVGENSVNTINSNSEEMDELIESNSAITVTDEQRQMVSFKAQSMGIQLAEAQVEVIASQLDSNNTSFTETIQQIEQALLDFIGYQSSTESIAINQMFDRVDNAIAQKTQTVNQQLTNGFESIGESLRQSQENQKTATTNILARLRVASN